MEPKYETVILFELHTSHSSQDDVWTTHEGFFSTKEECEDHSAAIDTFKRYSTVTSFSIREVEALKFGGKIFRLRKDVESKSHDQESLLGEELRVSTISEEMKEQLVYSGKKKVRDGLTKILSEIGPTARTAIDMDFTNLE